MCNTIHTTISYAPWAAARLWRFDLWSALMGAVVAFLLVGLAYVFRHQLRLGWDGAKAVLARLSHYWQATTEENYRELVAARARSLIIPSHLASLDEVFVEPRLRLLQSPTSTASEIDSSPADPLVLPLHRILGGHHLLAVLGAPGTGRTTLLAYLALVCARGIDAGDSYGGEDCSSLRLAQERLPLFVSLPAMDWDEQNEQEHENERTRNVPRTDGVRRLLGAAVTAVRGRNRMFRPVRQYLTSGQALVLVDGWDELWPRQQQRATVWLTELIDALPGTLWLVGAGERAYAPLTEAGFVPLALVPWDTGQIEQLARQWVEATLSDGEPPVVTSRDLAAELQRAARIGAPPLELALRAFVCLSDERPSPKRQATLFERALDLLLWQEDKPWLLVTAKTALGQIALTLQLNEGTSVGRQKIEEVVEAALPPAEEGPAPAVSTAIQALTGKRGMLRAVHAGHYAFVHPLWQAYFAARQLIAVDPTTLIERSNDARWAEVLRFYAEAGDMRPLVAARLRDAGDLFRTRLRTVGTWIRVAPEEVTWRNGAMTALAHEFLVPDTPRPVRRALAEALAASGASGVIAFLKKALQHQDKSVRACAAAGLAKVAGVSDLSVLEAAAKDAEASVRKAAVHALVHVDIDASRRVLERLLLEGDDELLPVVAEALAQRGEEGEAFLREAAEAESVTLRRAAVMGLARAGASDFLSKVAREDDQWIVRSAATAGLAELEEKGKICGVPPLPRIEQLPWLVSWAAAQGEALGIGQVARSMLFRAMSEGAAPVRLAATKVLALVGHPDHVEPLQQLLSDVDPAVAGAAFEALAEIGRRYDLKIK